MPKKVTFSVSTGYVGSERKETYSLEELGIDESLEGAELEKELEAEYEDWIWNNINSSFWITED